MGAWFIAILLTIKALATPLQLLNERIRRRRAGTVMLGWFLVADIASQIGLVGVWSAAAVVAWMSVGGA
jgi:Kef-type K+ transport system membrane component KefB